MRGRPVAWRRRRIVLFVHYLDVVSRAAIEAAIVPSRLMTTGAGLASQFLHRAVVIRGLGPSSGRASLGHMTSHFRTSCSPSGRTGTRAGPDAGLQHLPAKRHAIISADGRSAKPGMVVKPAWLGPLWCKPVCCSLADYGASTPPTTRSARERAQLR
jgi:hypothetical protein